MIIIILIECNIERSLFGKKERKGVKKKEGIKKKTLKVKTGKKDK